MDDELKITEPKVDFGSERLRRGRADARRPCRLEHRLEDAAVTPTVWGYLHLNNSDGDCARLNLRYRTEAGAEQGGEMRPRRAQAGTSRPTRRLGQGRRDQGPAPVRGPRAGAGAPPSSEIVALAPSGEEVMPGSVDAVRRSGLGAG